MYLAQIVFKKKISNYTSLISSSPLLAVDPIRYPAKVQMTNIHDWHDIASPPRLIINWDMVDISWAEADLVDIELWGYFEDDAGPHWDFLELLGSKKLNKGSYGFDVAPHR